MPARWIILALCLVVVAAACGDSGPAPALDPEERDLALAVTLANRMGDDDAFDAILLAADRGYTFDQVAAGISSESLDYDGTVASVEPAGSPAGVFTPHGDIAAPRFAQVMHVEDNHEQLRADALEWGVDNAGRRASGRSAPVAAATTLLYSLRSGFTGVQIFQAIGELAPLQRSEPCPAFEIGGGLMQPRGCR